MRLNILLLLCLALITFNIEAQNQKDCRDNCFNTTIKSVETTEDGCLNYSLEVSYSGDCTFALSHFTVDAYCGTITSLTNSENWKQEIGNTDPTTSLTGFKIDEIQNFGEKEGEGSFSVNFTICPESEECNTSLSCWSPVVAYKAGQCVVYDTASYQCRNLEATITSKNPSCGNGNDGELSVEILDGQGPFEYLWSTGAITESISKLSGGNYSVKITDAHGDTLNLTGELVAPMPITLTSTITNASCDGEKGTITVEASGGSESYTYNWSNGSTENTISQLSPGTFDLTVTDSTGCSYQQSFVVESSNALTLQGTVTNTGCVEDKGTIDITVSGGSGNYVYKWNDGETSEDRTNLATGYYTITVVDEGGCSSSRTFSVKQENLLSVTGVIVPTGCPDDNTGGVNLTLKGAVGDVEYKWNNGSTSANLSGVGTGKYEVVVSDDSGCSVTKSFYVFGDRLSIKSDVKQPSCFSEENGSISLTCEEEITVSWSNGSKSTTIQGLAPGLYTATVSNSAGCTNTFSYFLSSPEEITFQTEVLDSKCDSSSYSVNITASGGVGPYEITWGDGLVASTNTGLVGGSYSMTITDTNGCQISGIVEINDSVANCDETDPGNEDPDDGEDDENPEEGEDDGGDDDDGDDDDSDDDNGDGEDDDGEGDDDEGDDDEDNGGSDQDGNAGKDCGDPYNMMFTITDNGDCMTFEGKITYSGEKSFGLSHAVVSATCGDIEGLFSENGYFEEGLDPTTGLDGIKIDEISGFGEGNTEESLYFTFEMCEDGCKFGEEISFVVAYKFGQCVNYDTIKVELPKDEMTSSVYPNPASGRVNFNISQTGDGQPVTVELFNPYGVRVKVKEFPSGENLSLDINELPGDLYTYRIITGTAVKSGKVVVANN